MYNNQRSKIILERDYTIGSHQSGPSNRLDISRRGLKYEAMLNGVVNTGDSASNISWVDSVGGYNKQCASFGGTNSRIDVAESSNLNFTTEGYISAIIKTSTVSTMIFGNYSQAGAGSPIVGYQCYIEASGKIQFNFGTGGLYAPGVTFFSVAGGTSITDGLVHCVEFIKTPTQILVYVDGKLDGTTNTTATIGYSGNVRANIGANEYQPGTILNWFNGTIQNLRVGNLIPSILEIQNRVKEKNKLLH